MLFKVQNVCLINVMLTHASLSTAAFVGSLVLASVSVLQHLFEFHSSAVNTVHGQCSLAFMIE